MLRPDPRPLKEFLRSLPRVARGTLKLSVRDELLLRPFRRWLMPLDGLRRHLSELLVFGDLFVLNRLQAWTRTAEPVLLSRPIPQPHNWRRNELILTTHGRRTLISLDVPSSAPPFFMGGHEIYGRDSWAVTRSGRLQRV
jgi:hypothetical protein